jgi:hypothetical protein
MWRRWPSLCTCPLPYVHPSRSPNCFVLCKSCPRPCPCPCAAPIPVLPWHCAWPCPSHPVPQIMPLPCPCPHSAPAGSSCQPAAATASGAGPAAASPVAALCPLRHHAAHPCKVTAVRAGGPELADLHPRVQVRLQHMSRSSGATALEQEFRPGKPFRRAHQRRFMQRSKQTAPIEQSQAPGPRRHPAWGPLHQPRHSHGAFVPLYCVAGTCPTCSWRGAPSCVAVTWLACGTWAPTSPT